MHGKKEYIARHLEPKIRKNLEFFPCVALLGARQVGKSTLAKEIIKSYPNAVYLDLEDPRDFAKLQNPQLFFEHNQNTLICLDEIQRVPELFPILRGILDRGNRPGQLLILGSASRTLIRQSSESLAGRIAYIEIAPLTLLEIDDFKTLWLQGGYPPAYQADSEMSAEWRLQYIRNFLENDIPNLGIRIAPLKLRQLWSMLAHLNGTVLNYSTLANSLGVSSPTTKHYIDILEGTFVVRRLEPYASNLKKRMVKSPRIYIRDTGLLHSLLSVETYNDLLGHPGLGSSFESFVISTLLEKYPKHRPSFYRTQGGSEIDLVLEKGSDKMAIEIKGSATPKLSKGFYNAIDNIGAQQSFVIAQVDAPYPIGDTTWVHNLKSFIEQVSL